MKTRISLHRNLRRGAAKFLSVLAILAIALPVAGNAAAQEPVPWFTVFLPNSVEGWNWPLGATMHLSIDDPETELLPDFQRYGTMETNPWDPVNGGTWLWIDFSGEYVTKPGDVVTLTDGITPQTHTVQNVSITSTNHSENTVYGTTDEGKIVTLWSWEDPEGRRIQTDGSANWGVDFDDIGFDLQPGFHVRAEVWDGGNDTAVDREVANPHFTVFPEWEFFDGLNWPDGATVTITVADKPECTTSRESWDGFFNGNFGDGCNIEFGDEVTFTDGITTRTHNVRTLSVTTVDAENDLIKGIADAKAEVHVWPHATGQEQVTIGTPTGKWNASFDGVYDLKPGEDGRAQVMDEMGNATAVDWHAPKPRFTIYPDAQWFDGMDWPDGATVTITVKNKPECKFNRESWGGFFNGGFPEGCVVTTGDRVTFTGGNITLKHTVRNLAITMIDKDANTVKGSADTGAVVHTWVWNSDGSTLEGSTLEAIAVNGEWLADFDALGIDLEVGMGIQAEIIDENGNITSVDLLVPNPRIVASISEDWFYLADFLPSVSLTISIYENQDGALIWSTTGQEIKSDVNGFTWIDSKGWDLVPGNYLVVSDGLTTKALLIEGFTFDLFNLFNGQLMGTAPEPYGRNVWVGIGWENGGWSANFTTVGTGVWIADYGNPVPDDYQWVAAQIFDEDGDASELRPSHVINWSLVIANQPDWVDAGISLSSGQSFTVEALGIMNPCSDTYPNGDAICIFYTPLGAEWEVPYENQFGIFPGPGLQFMALLGRIDDGEPFYIGAGGSFTAEQSGTLWLTPNDNLRTDNQGAYSVQVLLVP